MLTSIYILSGISAILILGSIQTVIKYRSYNARIAFTLLYGEHYKKLTSGYFSRTFESDNYEWLTLNVNKMQRELGNDGVLAVFKLPYNQGVLRNYQIL